MRHFMSVVRETLFFRSVRIISQLINGKNTKEKVVLINVYCCKQFHSETFCIYWIVRRLWNSFHGVINTAGMWNIKYKLRFATFHQYILKYVLTLHRKNSVKFEMSVVCEIYFTTMKETLKILNIEYNTPHSSHGIILYMNVRRL
jgi:hypothetical protein